MEDYCLVVSKRILKEVRKYLNQLEISDPTRRLQSNLDDDTVAVPINVSKIMKSYEMKIDNEEDLNKVIYSYLSQYAPGLDFLVMKKNLPVAKKLKIKRPETQLKESLQILFEKKGLKWSHTIGQEIPSHWERHDDLILIPASSFISPVWKDLGNELWDCVTACLSCRRIAGKDVVLTNGYRSPQVCMLYGDDSWVVQTDNGIKYTYDTTKCMFSSGNITEKLRVANFDCTDEIVVDLYAGIGYFTLPYLVYTNVKHLHACEWNPDAVEALKKNLRMNKVQDRCTVHQGDNREVCPKGIADRVNLGLIPSSRDGWPIACTALNPQTGGILHIHHNVNTKPKAISKDNQELFTNQRDPFLCEDKLSPSQNTSDVKTIVENFRETCDVGQVAEKDNCESSLKSNCNRKDSLTGESTVDDISVVTQGTGDSDDSLFADNTEQSKKPCCNAARSIVSCETQDNLTELSHVDISNKTTSNSIDRYCNQISSVKVNSKYSKWLPWAQEVSMEIKNILDSLHKKDWKTSIIHIEHVKSYAPHVDHVVLDLECRPLFKRTLDFDR